MRVAEIDQEKFLRKMIRGDRLAVRVGEHQRMFEHDPLFLRLCSGDEGGEQHEQQSGRAQLHLIRTPRLGYASTVRASPSRRVTPIRSRYSSTSIVKIGRAHV